MSTVSSPSNRFEHRVTVSSLSAHLDNHIGDVLWQRLGWIEHGVDDVDDAVGSLLVLLQQQRAVDGVHLSDEGQVTLG